ncbi:MAG: hypothetical protein KME45_04380 [Stenomitos rutilans HA7619-LM2]|nr:hypothetical protein [Stenomitos rutilans HA7619-LM2]
MSHRRDFGVEDAGKSLSFELMSDQLSAVSGQPPAFSFLAFSLPYAFGRLRQREAS